MGRQSEGPWFRRGKNAWYVWHEGRQVGLGVKGREGRKQAVEAWHRLMAGGSTAPAGDGGDGGRGGKNGEAVPTVRAVADAFLADAATRCKPESMAVYRSALNRFATRFGDRPAASVRPFEAEAFANRKDWSSSTRNTFLSAVVTAFRWAVRSGMLGTNPLAGIRKPPMGSRGASAVITPEQFAKLCEVTSPAFRTFLTGLWLTGCRPGELARLTAADVNWGNAVAVLTEHKTARQTGRPRLIFLSPSAQALLREQAERHPDGPLFRNSWGNACDLPPRMEPTRMLVVGPG